MQVFYAFLPIYFNFRTKNQGVITKTFNKRSCVGIVALQLRVEILSCPDQLFCTNSDKETNRCCRFHLNRDVPFLSPKFNHVRSLTVHSIRCPSLPLRERNAHLVQTECYLFHRIRMARHFPRRRQIVIGRSLISEGANRLLQPTMPRNAPRTKTTALLFPMLRKKFLRVISPPDERIVL